MKLTARDIAGFLQSPDRQAAAVLLYGPDAGLIRERSRLIATRVLDKDSDPLNRIELSAEQVKADPASLRDELCALSLMGGRRLVVVRDAGDKHTAAIESALEGAQATAYLIVEADELSASSSLRRYFEGQEGCAALPCYHDEGRTLEDTLRAALAKHGLRASPDAMQFLLTHLGNDRGITLSEIEKIALYLGDAKELNLEIAGMLIGHNASESMEDICHAVACGQLTETHGLLLRLIGEGVQPVAIMRALLRHFQRLETARCHMDAGQSAEQALAALRPPVFFKYAPPTKRALSIWSARALSQVLGLLLKAERELKSGLLSPTLVADHALQQVARMAAA